MNLSKVGKRFLIGIALLIIVALLCVSSYQSFAYNRIVPINVFESILSDSCKIIVSVRKLTGQKSPEVST
jgi:hypothetical protein